MTPDAEGLRRPRRRPAAPTLQLLLLATTVVTTTVTGALWAGGDLGSPATLLRGGLPYSMPLLAILLAHESGHYLMCRYHGLEASLPYFLPAPPTLTLFGTFGAFIRIRSPFRDRRSLFDVGAGGPWAGFVVAVAALIVGLRLSSVEPLRPGETVFELGDSLLTGALTHLIVGADPTAVRLHPVALAGWFGLFVTSINLFPVGQLDGGHVLYAALGRRRPWVSALLIAGLLWIGWQRWIAWLAWSVILGVLVILGHPATQNDGTPLDPWRRLGAIATLLLFAATFVAEPFRLIN